MFINIVTYLCPQHRQAPQAGAPGAQDPHGRAQQPGRAEAPSKLLRSILSGSSRALVKL